MLKIENLRCEIQGKTILNGISLSAKNSEIVVITGVNGSGKTTLLKVIAGIIPNSVGKIMLDDKDISSFSIDKRANSGLVFAFQEPITFKGITIKNLFEITAKQSFKIDNACNFLSQVGLCARDYIDRDFDKKLSGGERKRIEIAITLSRNASVNLFDEPEAGIDMWSFDELTKIFQNLKKENKTTIIVSHNKKIMEIADKIIVLQDGKINQQGSPKNVLKNINTNLCIKLQGGK